MLPWHALPNRGRAKILVRPPAARVVAEGWRQNELGKPGQPGRAKYLATIQTSTQRLVNVQFFGSPILIHQQKRVLSKTAMIYEQVCPTEIVTLTCRQHPYICLLVHGLSY
jgi:hypothetical protein